MKIIIKTGFLGLLLLFLQCRNTSKKDLATIEKQELATGIRQDSLFMGIYLGMPKNDFFNHCWHLNKQGVFTEGSNRSVEYQLGHRYFNYPIQMNFCPQFKSDKISAVPIRFTYKDIDLTRPNQQTDKLAKDVKKLMSEWFGEGFFTTFLSENQKAYIQVSGNRRVMITTDKDFEVQVTMTDLTAEK